VPCSVAEVARACAKKAINKINKKKKKGGRRIHYFGKSEYMSLTWFECGLEVSADRIQV
jgi:hypothetical protein